MKPIVRLFTTCSPPLLVSGNSIRNSFKKGISVSFAFFASSVLAVAQLTVPEGFVAEKIYDVPNKEQGSWISLAADQKGHIYAGSEKHGLYRFKIPAPASTVTDVQPAFGFKAKPLGVQGLLWAFDSLYVMINNRKGQSGLFRATDGNGDGKLDDMRQIISMRGGGGHGLHAIIPSPDGKTLTINAGNMGGLPKKIDDSRVPLVWGEDLLLPRLPDANGHASTTMAPGGWIARINPDGSNFELIATGFRNEYDVTYDRLGELFTFDADMEFDMGTPWYRPTRVCHVVSGGEYGWRNGSGKWPAYFPDSLPATLDIGPSSPTGVLHGTDARFPTRYRKAMFICDWSYGQIYAIHLTPKGASYTAEPEVFCSGRPFAVVDAIIAPDGAMYAVTGGRNIKSAVWRIRYTGTAQTAPPDITAPTSEAKLRRQLETLHRPNEGAIANAWPHLSHPDRFVRFAARIAIEHQPVSQWQSKVFSETDPRRLILGAIALARHADESVGGKLIIKLCSIDFAKLETDAKLDHLRALSLVQVRLGRNARVGQYLKPHFPNAEDLVNRELARLLIAADEPSAVPTAVKLMTTLRDEHEFRSEEMLKKDQHGQYGKVILAIKQTPPPTSQMHYAMLLRNAKSGWTGDLRAQYGAWLTNAQNQVGGRSYVGFIKNIRRDAIAGLSLAEKVAFAYKPGEKLSALPQPKGPGRNWTISEIEGLTKAPLTGRSFADGEKMYAATLCASCHQFKGEGGAIGPDLTQLGTRFGYKDIAEAIIEPSKVISDQYDSKFLNLKNGKVISGRIMKVDKKHYLVSSNPFQPEKLDRVAKKSVASIKSSPVSLMPPALINSLNKEELLDLLAYLTSEGNPTGPAFK